MGKMNLHYFPKDSEQMFQWLAKDTIGSEFGLAMAAILSIIQI
jgi:hypothetical protein